MSKNFYIVQQCLNNGKWVNEIFTLSNSRRRSIELWNNAFGHFHFERRKINDKNVRTVKVKLEVCDE